MATSALASGIPPPTSPPYEYEEKKEFDGDGAVGESGGGAAAPPLTAPRPYVRNLEKGIYFNRFFNPPISRLEEADSLAVVITNPGTWVPPNDEFRLHFLKTLEPQFQERMAPYYEQMQKSMGFEVPDLPNDIDLVPFEVIQSKSGWRYFTPDVDCRIRKCANTAVYRLTKIMSTEYELMEVEKANCYQCWCELYYITFKARNVSTDQPETFEAVVQSKEHFRFPKVDGQENQYFNDLCFIRRKLK